MQIYIITLECRVLQISVELKKHEKRETNEINMKWVEPFHVKFKILDLPDFDILDDDSHIHFEWQTHIKVEQTTKSEERNSYFRYDQRFCVLFAWKTTK